jgi:hypothetical protein
MRPPRGSRMPQNQSPEDRTPKGFPLTKSRKRSAVIRDFEKASGPLRGQNRDRKPKA